MSHTHLRRLLDHMAWADDELVQALRATAAPDVELLRLCAHVLGAELVWLERLRGLAPSLAVWPELDLAGVLALAARARDGYAELFVELQPDELTREVAYTNSAGQAFRTPLEDILLHVALHGAYHRGQLARGLRDAGSTPPPTDYIGYVRGVPAARRDGDRGRGA